MVDKLDEVVELISFLLTLCRERERERERESLNAHDSSDPRLHSHQ
jgi:hypothetical protein